MKKALLLTLAALGLQSANAQISYPKGSLTYGTSVTTQLGTIKFDTNAWATSRGAVQAYDGTANTFLVGALASDTPSNGQIPTWNTGGTVTWESPGAGSVLWNGVGDPDGNNSVSLGNWTSIFLSTLDSGVVYEISDTDADAAAATTLLKLSHDDGADTDVTYLSMIGDKNGTPTNDYLFTQARLTATLPFTTTDYTSTGQTFYINSAQTVFWKAGTGSPEAAVTGGIGSLWSRTDGTTDTALYRKETGAGNTGWVAVAAGGGSGSVATDAIWDAAGDIVYGTGANTASRLAIGTEGQTLAVSAGGIPEWLTTPLLGTAQTFTAQQTFSKAPTVSRTDLAGGTSLTIGTYYYDALTTTRTLTFSGTPAAGNTISLKLVVTNAPVLTIPSCKRAGEANSAITSIQMTNGVHVLTWTYVNAEWILNDTVGGPLDNAGYAEDAGANDTYVAALVPIPSAYVTGLAYRFKAATANTGAASINFNSLGAKTIVKAAGGTSPSWTTLANNDILAGQWVDLVYDGSVMQMQSALGNAPAGSGTVTSVGWTGGIVSIATATSTPAFTIAGTSGGIPYFSSTSTWATSAALAANALVVGGGAGAAPATVTTGTGVLTALSNTANATGGVATVDGTKTLTGTTLDASATGNVLKQFGYLVLTHPHVFGSGVTQQTTVTANTYGQALFANATDKATNYVEYYCVIPPDIDTAVDLTGTFKFKLGGADTNDHEYEITFDSVADSAAYAGTLADAISLAFTADATGADADTETAGETTLTGWRSAMTAGQLMVIRVARDGDHASDTSTVNSYSGPLVIKYGITQ